MANPQPTNTARNSESAGLSLDDVFFILFRHKWKIVSCALLGVLAAGGLVLLKKPIYASEAQILIQYIVDAEAASTEEGKSVRSIAGENVLSSEMEIIRSMDLALGVADSFGPEKILARVGGGNDRNAAATLVRRGIDLKISDRSSVIKVTFSHPDPAVVQPVLEQLVAEYVAKHLEIHQGVGVMNDFFQSEAKKVEENMRETEEELRALRRSSGVVSLEETKKSYVEALAGIQGKLRAAEADLEEHKAILNELQRQAGATADAELSGGVPEEMTNRYLGLSAQLALLRKELQEKSLKWKDESTVIRGIQGQIKTVEAEKKGLEKDHPTLAHLSVPSIGTNSGALDLPTTRIKVISLEATIAVLKAQETQCREDADRVSDAEPELKHLETKRDLLKDRLSNLRNGIERAGSNKSVDQAPNINITQQPTQPVRDSRKLKKPVMAILLAGVLGGIGLAFLIELVLDRSVKRPSDVERRLNLPLFLSIPDSSRNGRFRLSKFFGKRKPRPAPPPVLEGELVVDGLVPVVAPTETAPWAPTHALNSYFEALRDRLITYFEVRNMTHKPKLVGVTSCNHGAGVSTMAAGLAASLSETGDGNVLLVDMNVKEGAAYQFRWGKPGCGLSEILQTEKPETALIQQNLYMASAHANGENELAGVLPKRFAHLVPLMKTSDFDYIIFDLPPVNQTSVTPRLSSHMDMVMMIVESEKSGVEAVKRATNLLQDAGATASAVLNKHHKYVPDRLSEDL